MIMTMFRSSNPPPVAFWARSGRPAHRATPSHPASLPESIRPAALTRPRRTNVRIPFRTKAFSGR